MSFGNYVVKKVNKINIYVWTSAKFYNIHFDSFKYV